MKRLQILLAVLAFPVLAANEPAQQTVTPVAPQAEQRVEPVAPAGEQHVEALDVDGVQKVAGANRGGPVRRGAGAVAKVFVGIAAAGIAIGATVASLLLL